jgi:hypothetical protein
LKRSADAIVANGTDVPDAASFYRLLADKTTIKLYFVPDSCVREAMQSARIDIPPIPGTMKIHPLVTVRRGELLYRSISCACSPGLGYGCACFSAKTHTYQIDSAPISAISNHSAETNVIDTAEVPEQVTVPFKTVPVEDWSNPALIGQYCCVEYDGKAYPGVIRNIDESDVEVQCMHAVGANRFFWPEKNIDVCWYPCDRILALIPEPRKVTSRHKEVEPTIWAAILQNLADSSS